MKTLFKYKNKLAFILIVITVIRVLLIFFSRGLLLSDVIDSLIPIGGAIFLFMLKPQQDNNQETRK